MGLNPTYDDLRAQAVLVTCAKCQQPYYMEKPQPVCVKCRIRDEFGQGSVNGIDWDAYDVWCESQRKQGK